MAKVKQGRETLGPVGASGKRFRCRWGTRWVYRHDIDIPFGSDPPKRRTCSRCGWWLIIGGWSWEIKEAFPPKKMAQALMEPSPFRLTLDGTLNPTDL